MRIVSWNVNGFRAVQKKGFADAFSAMDASIVCLQETKLQAGQHDAAFPGYRQYWNYAEKKGYSGTVIFTKETPEDVVYGIGQEVHDKEGRVITLDYPAFYMVNCYTPNAQDSLARLGYRMDWEDAFRTYLLTLKAKKPVILCGDLNVAHQEIDLKNPKQNRQSAGFTDEERGKFGELLQAGFADTFRRLYPEATDAYTWWSYRAGARERNTGWRIDYFVVSEDIMPLVKDSRILPTVYGSDHCPVLLELDARIQIGNTPMG